MTSHGLSKLMFCVTLTLGLTACGVETVGTAAVAAKAKMEEAKAGEALKTNLQNQLDAAALVEKQRLEQLEAGSRP